MKCPHGVFFILSEGGPNCTRCIQEDFWRESHTCQDCGEVNQDVQYRKWHDEILCPECADKQWDRMVEREDIMHERN